MTSILKKKSRKLEINSYNEKAKFFNPFATGLNLWQSYSLLCMNLTKEMLSNTTRMTRDFENTIGMNRTNYNWFKD